ncbi:MAG TPA: zf-HC2 domain-containing protein [Rudaea sp.]|nr:zf-HC2 domain-containing protein [Rudaea sp.]
MRSLAKSKMLRLSCQQASRLLSQQQEEPLPFGKRVRLRLHLMYCDACTNVSRQFETLRLAMQRWREKD